MVIGLMVMLVITSTAGIALTGEESQFLEEVHEVAANLTVVLAGLHVAGLFVSKRRASGEPGQGHDHRAEAS